MTRDGLHATHGGTYVLCYDELYVLYRPTAKIEELSGVFQVAFSSICFSKIDILLLEYFYNNILYIQNELDRCCDSKSRLRTPLSSSVLAVGQESHANFRSTTIF